ncbi:MAG: phospholipase D-like domain-containing protein [Lysobacterales bacterium]
MQTLLDQLERSIADAVLSSAEKRALAAALHERPLRIEQLRQLRNHSFDLVLQRSRDPAQAVLMPELIKWLGEVVKVVDQAAAQVAVDTRVWFSPGDDCRDAVIRHFQSCRKQVDVCVFTIADNDISAAIIAAHQRGVAVRVISDNHKRHDAGSDIDRMVESGIEVVLDDSDAHMHHKFALFDGRWLLNGSFNWTRSASRANDENLVVTNDPKQLRLFGAQFEELWERLS